MVRKNGLPDFIFTPLFADLLERFFQGLEVKYIPYKEEREENASGSREMIRYIFDAHEFDIERHWSGITYRPSPVLFSERAQLFLDPPHLEDFLVGLHVFERALADDFRLLFIAQ